MVTTSREHLLGGNDCGPLHVILCNPSADTTDRNTLVLLCITLVNAHSVDRARDSVQS